MVKGAAIETVLLLQQCHSSIAENFAVAVRDMNAVLLEKQQELLARAEEAPLELSPPIPQLNACEFPTSRKRKMTGYEAAIREEHDTLVKRWRDARQVQGDEDSYFQYRKEPVARIIECHSQRQQSSAPLSLSPSSSVPPPPPRLNPSPSGTSSSCSKNDSDSDGDSDGDSDKEIMATAETAEAQRPRRGVRRTQKLVDNSQTAKDVAASMAPTRRKPRKKALAAAAAAEISQLLDGYMPPPSSAVLLDN